MDGQAAANKCGNGDADAIDDQRNVREDIPANGQRRRHGQN